MFADETFQAFVYDFYHSIPYAEDVPQCSDILKMIFSDDRFFSDFLKFCRDNKCSFVDNSKGQDELTISLHLFDCLREVYIENVAQVLEISHERVHTKMRTWHLNHEPTDLWESLQLSIRNGIPINDRGEVIYTLEATDSGYRVYSYQSKEHEVNYQWEITRDNLKNKSERASVLKKIQRYEKVQYLLWENQIDQILDMALVRRVQNDFEARTWISWPSPEKDPKGAKAHMLKFRYYLAFQIMDLEKKYKQLKIDDTKPRLRIVWWTDI